MKRINTRRSALALFFAAFLLVPESAIAHCDTMNGPVVADAQTALETGDLMPVFKWIAEEDESEVTAAFDRARVVRVNNRDSRELADLYFFETVVRLHRSSEGVPYTGIKPASTDVGPATAAADRALESGSADSLAELLTAEIDAAVQGRFADAYRALQQADDSVAAGREFVKAYVAFTHLAERIHETVEHASPEHQAEAIQTKHAHFE